MSISAPIPLSSHLFVHSRCRCLNPFTFELSRHLPHNKSSPHLPLEITSYCNFKSLVSTYRTSILSPNQPYPSSPAISSSTQLTPTSPQGRRKNSNRLRPRRRRNTTSRPCSTRWLLNTSHTHDLHTSSFLLHCTFSSSKLWGGVGWGFCLHCTYMVMRDEGRGRHQ